MGADRPARTPTVAARSNRLRALVAVRTPTPMPTISQRITPPKTTETVIGRSWARIVLTGTWL